MAELKIHPKRFEILDANDPLCSFRINIDVLNECFGANRKSDIDKIKKMSKDLLQKIKEHIAGMDHLTDKQETRAAVYILIRNVLYEEIPDSMFDRLEAYRKSIYEYVYTHYKLVS